MKKHLNKTMVEFVLEQHTILIEPQSLYEQNQIRALRFEKILNYANALSQTPRLGHFIPCDENDVPLSSPIEYSGMDSDAVATVKYYQQACDRVLFEGFFIDKLPNDVMRLVVIVHKSVVCVFWYNLAKDKKWSLSAQIETYEDLIKHNLPLTDNGAKFFGL